MMLKRLFTPLLAMGCLAMAVAFSPSQAVGFLEQGCNCEVCTPAGGGIDVCLPAGEPTSGKATHCTDGYPSCEWDWCEGECDEEPN